MIVGPRVCPTCSPEARVPGARPGAVLVLLPLTDCPRFRAAGALAWLRCVLWPSLHASVWAGEEGAAEGTCPGPLSLTSGGTWEGRAGQVLPIAPWALSQACPTSGLKPLPPRLPSVGLMGPTAPPGPGAFHGAALGLAPAPLALGHRLLEPGGRMAAGDEVTL